MMLTRTLLVFVLAAEVVVAKNDAAAVCQRCVDEVLTTLEEFYEWVPTVKIGTTRESYYSSIMTIKVPNGICRLEHIDGVDASSSSCRSINSELSTVVIKVLFKKIKLSCSITTDRETNLADVLTKTLSSLSAGAILPCPQYAKLGYKECHKIRKVPFIHSGHYALLLLHSGTFCESPELNNFSSKQEIRKLMYKTDVYTYRLRHSACSSNQTVNISIGGINYNFSVSKPDTTNCNEALSKLAKERRLTEITLKGTIESVQLIATLEIKSGDAKVANFTTNVATSTIDTECTYASNMNVIEACNCILNNNDFHALFDHVIGVGLICHGDHLECDI